MTPAARMKGDNLRENRKFIQVTGRQGSAFLVPVDQIAYIQDDQDFRTICLNDARRTNLHVQDSTNQLKELLRR